MSSQTKVALIGATGNLGSVMLPKLLAANFAVTILTRQGSKSTANLPAHQNQTIKEVNYSSKESIAAAMKGNSVVVCTSGGIKPGDQDLLIDAAIETGVSRFIPSEFGSDISFPGNDSLPVFAGKVQTAKYLEDAAAAHPDFTWTSIQNNAFLDWGMSAGFVIDVKQHSATLWEGGDKPYSSTTLSTVGDAVVAIINNLDATANKTVKIHDAVVTQNQLISMVKKIDGKEWSTNIGSVDEAEANAYAELKKENPNIGMAMVGFLRPAIWGKGREVFASQIDNKLLGLKTMSESEVEEVVRKVVQA